jgi:hypothetical protein
MSKNKKASYDLFQSFKKYAVKANSIEDFCNKYHNAAAFHNRGKEYMEIDIASHKKEFAEEGYTIIPQGSSIIGDVVSYYGKQK